MEDVKVSIMSASGGQLRWRDASMLADLTNKGRGDASVLFGNFHKSQYRLQVSNVTADTIHVANNDYILARDETSSELVGALEYEMMWVKRAIKVNWIYVAPQHRMLGIGEKIAEAAAKMAALHHFAIMLSILDGSDLEKRFWDNFFSAKGVDMFAIQTKYIAVLPDGGTEC